MNTSGGAYPVYVQPTFVPQPATPVYPVYPMASGPQPQAGTEPVRYEKNSAMFIIMCIFVGLNALSIFSYLTTALAFGVNIYLLYLTCMSTFIVSWGVMALKDETFFLEPEKLQKRCLPWLGMSALAIVACVMTVFLENTLNVSFIGSAIFNGIMFYCFKKSQYFRPWRVVQPSLPQYYHYHA